MNDVSHDVVLSVRDLQTHFHTQRGVGKAVDGVSFDLHRGETLGLVGESGCGKSMTSLSIVGLYPRPAARIVGGQILFDGEDLVQLSPGELRRYRGKRLAMILQDPMSALNPVFTINNQLSEPLRLHQHLRGVGLWRRAIELLKLLRIPAPDQRLSSYPHQFSGGMRQRVAIARALALRPSLIVLDEPVSALDVSIRAQIMNLFKDLQEQFGIAYLLIAHNLATVRYLSHQVAVMYLGKLVESAPSEALFTNPLHPYTKALISAALPTRPGEAQDEILLSGEVPSPANPPSGCHFHPRCPLALPRCSEDAPGLRPISPGHRVACHLY